MKIPSLKFQYILCVGSSFAFFVGFYIRSCFNTSYVSVQAFGGNLKENYLHSFNTSYVSVQAVE